MTKRIKMYNHTYKLAHQLLKTDSKMSLAHLVLCVMNQLSPKYNYSKEGLKWAWTDFHRPSPYFEFGEWATFTSPISTKTTNLTETYKQVIASYTSATKTVTMGTKPHDKDTFIIK
jgi:hypothetical protein